MSAKQTWVVRLSILAFVLLHVSGAIIGAGLSMVLGAIVLAIFQVKDDGNIALIAITFFLVGAILPSLLLWRAQINPFGLHCRLHCRNLLSNPNSPAPFPR